MVSAFLVFGAVFVLQFLLAAVVSWLSHRQNANWLHVACVCNTVLFTCLLLTIDQFRHDGLTLYSVFFAAMMLWLAAVTAKMGTTGMQTARANQNRPAKT
jgi:hypothetical protein